MRGSRFAGRMALAVLLASTSIGGAWAAEPPRTGEASQARFTIPAQDLAAAMLKLSRDSGRNILFAPDAAAGRISAPVVEATSFEQALTRMLAGSGLQFSISSDGSALVTRAAPRTGSATRQPVPTPAAAGVEEIFVTARKRSELLREVPQSMTALTGVALERLNAQAFEDYATLIPSLSYNSSGAGRNQITLRGITSGQQQGNATVATYIDDTPFGSSSVFAQGGTLAPDIDMFDIDRLEVLRGPQGTLYGASSLGGLLKYVTKAPDFSGFSAKGLAEISSTEHGGIGFAFKGMVNVPVNDKVAFRLSAHRRTDPGFADNPQLAQKNINLSRFSGGRLAVEFQPDDTLSVRLNAQLQDLRSEGTPVEDVDHDTLKPLYGDLVQRRYLPETYHQRFRGLNATVNWQVHGVTLTSSTSFAKVSYTQSVDETQRFGPLLTAITGLPLLVGGPLQNPMRKFTQETRLASESGAPLEWQLGSFVTHEKTDQFQGGTALLPDGTLAPQPFANLVGAGLPARYFEYAFFASATYYVTPSFDVTAGVRWSRNEQHFTQSSTGFLLNPADPSVVQSLRTQSADQSWTYSISPRWRVTDNAMLYARVAKGYRPGGPNVVTPAALGSVPASFGPDSLVNYEVGAKTEFLDKRLTVDLSAFYIDWSQIQLTASNAGFTYLSNGGAAKSRGVELTTSYAPVNGLTLGASLAYVYANLTQDAPGVGGAKGDLLPTVPRWGVSATGDYRFPLFGDVNATVGATYRYVGARLSDYGVGRGRVSLPSYDVVDLRAGLESGRWSATLFVKNLGNERGIVSVDTIGLDPSTSPLAATIIRPRSIGLIVTANF